MSSSKHTVLMIGDVVGANGIAALKKTLPNLIDEFKAEFCVVNGENAREGFGMAAEDAENIFAAGADVITSGNHIWEKRDFITYMETNPRVLRPANYSCTSGRGFISIEKKSLTWCVINLQGREYMTAIDCPFRCFDNFYKEASAQNAKPPLIIVDFHAESNPEKEALAFYLDGRAVFVAGTHTHVQTADERVLPNGTAYITDLGMCGVEDSIIGMNTENCLDRVKTQVFYKLECANGAVCVQGAAAVIDAQSGTAISIQRFSRITPND